MSVQPNDDLSSPLPPFKYGALETPRSFRLLQLRRNFSCASLSSFNGRLKDYHLDTCPSFTAISYVWGDPTLTVPFQCGGKILQITQNCYDALERLIRGRSRRLVWVDAICIDQTNVGEKSVQVSLMCDIYTTARHVMIWLGPGTAASDEGMQRLWTCGIVHKLATFHGPWRQRRMRTYMRYIEKGFDNKPSQYGTLSAGTIGELLSNEWFERLWVLQEAALPPASRVAMYSGKRRVRLDSVTQIASFATGWECKIDHWAFTRASTHCAALLVIKNIKIGDRGPDNRFRVLNIANQKYTSDPSDHVYAVYGIAMRNGLTLPMPDYSKPVAEVFTETARHCIETEQILSILVMAGGETAFPLPSWVPDFSLSMWHVNTSDYRATRFSKTFFSFDLSGLQLTVRGLLLDTVQMCGPAFPMTKTLFTHKFYTMKSEFAQALRICVPAWIKMARENYKKEPEETDLHLQWTLGMDEPLKPDDKPQLFELDLMEYHFGQENEYSATQAGDLEFLRSMLPMWWAGRRFFVTESGRMGLGPGQSEPGDCIALISGLRLPFIVRKDGPYFRLIGWTFVYGIMNSQAWPEESELRDITIV